MKTVVIYESFDSNLVFFVVDGDHSYANNQYVNTVTCSEESLNFINSLDFEKGKLDTFPIDIVKNEECIVNRRIEIDDDLTVTVIG